jgi:acetyl-CoA synthetase
LPKKLAKKESTQKVNTRSVLIVDDEPIVRESLRDFLGASGFEAVIAEDSEQALGIVKKQKFAVAVIDVRLPGKDGVAFFGEAQQLQPNMKGIIITAYPTVDNTRNSIRLGAVDFIVKPFSPEELVEKIENLIDHRGEKVAEKVAVQKPQKTEVSDKGLTSMMEEDRVFPPSPEFSKAAELRSLAEYKALYNWSATDPEGFWSEIANQLHWFKKWDKVCVDDEWVQGKHQWFVGGKLNVTYNCIDRHLTTWRKNKAALIWEGDIGDTKTLTYQELFTEVSKFANVLKKYGVKKGDRVCIYLPMILELPIALLACARIGAVHSVVFGGFAAEALKDRMQDCGASVLICSDGYYRSGKVIRSKDNADVALESCPGVKTCFVVQRAGIQQLPMKAGRDYWWHVEMNAEDIRPVCPAEVLDSEDPLFILYTSGSTGKPKGVLHTQAGYLTYTYQTMKWVFDLKEDDTYWCTADIGWVTGHSYIVYGPLACGASIILFEGVPTYPKPDRFWQMVEKYGVNIFYTAPTALRSLMREGDDWPNKHDLTSLRLLGTVGEPINPEAWIWYYNVIGKGRCPIVDTWWQTETGGILITPLPGAVPTKPGSATVPFPGIVPAILREDGTEADTNEGGYLVIKRPWPGLMRGVYGDPQRFYNTYFTRFSGVYTTGDSARRDEDGYYWLMGRMDDVLKVSGHRIGTAEVESALVSNPKVAEAAVVGMPHAIKGQSIYAYVTLKTGIEKTDALKQELVQHVRKEMGPIATPEKIQFADALPKTRSGKIMRRILTKISAGETDNLGDITTLADPSVVATLVEGAKSV